MEKGGESFVLVAGAGAGGLATALSAARQGARVILVEKAARLGGTVSRSLIHTIGGLYDSNGDLINQGLPIELVERLMRYSSLTMRRRMGRIWAVSVAPEVYERVISRWIAEETRVSVLYNARIGRITSDTKKITQVEIQQGNRSIILSPEAVVDATGQAEIPHRLNPGLVGFEESAAAGLIFTMRPVDQSALRFPRNLELLRSIRNAARTGILPKECENAWLDIGVYEHEIYLKLFLPMDANWRDENVQRSLLQKGYQQRDQLGEFLKKLPPFKDARITQTGDLGIRDGGTVTGDYYLTATDIRQAKKFPDAAARCAWPIEYWDPQAGVQLEYLPDGDFYEIPLRSLKVKECSNLWVAGKCLSADHYARASARVAGCCWAMGDAVGRKIASTVL